MLPILIYHTEHLFYWIFLIIKQCQIVKKRIHFWSHVMTCVLPTSFIWNVFKRSPGRLVPWMWPVLVVGYQPWARERSTSRSSLVPLFITELLCAAPSPPTSGRLTEQASPPAQVPHGQKSYVEAEKSSCNSNCIISVINILDTFKLVLY